MSNSDDILALAVQQGLLNAADAHLVAVKAKRDGGDPLAAAVQQGLLSDVGVTIVRHLASPRDVAPGYELESLLGHGGMGIVYRARQLTLDRSVALKLMTTNRLGDPGSVQRFQREAAAIGRLRHPNLVAAFDFGRHEDVVYLAMELVEGTDVDRWLRDRGPAAERAAWQLARQAAAGLFHAAEHQVIHRDLKPANLLLVQPPEGFETESGFMLKVADFGLAVLNERTDTRLTAAHTTLGSPQYMAPEQFEHNPVDCRADIYGLGATVFHMLTGRAPYAGMNLAEIISQKLTQPPPRVSAEFAVSTSTEQLVQAMMANSADERIGSYPELLARIDELLAGFGTADGEPQPVKAGARQAGVAGETATPPPTSAQDDDRTRVLPAQQTAAMPAVDSEAVMAAARDAVLQATTEQAALRSRRRWLWAPVALVLCLVVGWATWWFWPRVPKHLSGIWWDLYSSDHHDHWVGDRGSTRVGQDDQKLYVLAIDGELKRRIHKARPGEPLPHYVLSMQIRLDGANAVMIELKRDEVKLKTLGGSASFANMVIEELHGNLMTQTDTEEELVPTGSQRTPKVGFRPSDPLPEPTNRSPRFNANPAETVVLRLDSKGVHVKLLAPGVNRRPLAPTNWSEPIPPDAYVRVTLERFLQDYRIFVNGRPVAHVRNHSPRSREAARQGSSE